MNPLIYGKDTTERIVNISHKDGAIYAFTESATGEVTQSDAIPWKPWAISSKNVQGSTVLDGTQHYKYLHHFSSLTEMKEKRNKVYELDMYTVWNMAEQFMLIEGATYFKGMNIKDVSVLSFDIETDGLKHTDNSKVFMIGNTFRKGDVIEKRLFNLKDYGNDCGALIHDWCLYVQQCNPSVLLGHNIISYDLPYLNHVASLNGVALLLGRDSSEIVFDERPSKFRKDATQKYEYFNPTIFGREIIDTFFLSVKFDLGRKYNSYGLKQIIKQEGLEKEGRAFVDAVKIKQYYDSDTAMYALACEYCKDDSEDALKIYDLMIAPTFYFTQTVPMTFQQMIGRASGSQLNSLMVRAYLSKGHSIAKGNKSEGFTGALSLGIPGIYNEVFKIDAVALYPSIMRQYKIFSQLKDPKRYFSELVEYYAIERLKNKSLAKETGLEYYKGLEQSQKVVANSFFGFLGAPGLNYNYPEGAALITKYGREILEKTIMFSTNKDYNYWKNMVIE